MQRWQVGANCERWEKPLHDNQSKIISMVKKHKHFTPLQRKRGCRRTITAKTSNLPWIYIKSPATDTFAISFGADRTHAGKTTVQTTASQHQQPLTAEKNTRNMNAQPAPNKQTEETHTHRWWCCLFIRIQFDFITHLLQIHKTINSSKILLFTANKNCINKLKKSNEIALVDANATPNGPFFCCSFFVRRQTVKPPLYVCVRNTQTPCAFRFPLCSGWSMRVTVVRLMYRPESVMQILILLFSFLVFLKIWI